MLKAIETENVVKNIIHEIMRECTVKGIKTTETLASYMIRLLVANPDYGFMEHNDKPLQREDVEKLVSLCVKRLSERNSPSLSCIKMQVYFESNFSPREEMIADNREGIATRLSPLIKEIVETTSHNKEDLEKLYRKIIVAIVLSSGLGNPTNYPVLREATVALQSVFPPSELGQFMSLLRKEKEQQITELTQIVMGIRLFNMDCQKGGEGIDDIPHSLQLVLTATQDTLQSSLKKLMARINILSAAIDTILTLESARPEEVSDEEEEQEEGHGGGGKEKEEDKKHINVSDEEKCDEKNKNLIKAALISARQLEVYIRKLLSVVSHANGGIRELIENLQTRLLKIHDIVRFRTAIPTAQVYPQFISLSKIWSSLQDEIVMLSTLNTISWSLHAYSPVLDFVPTNVLKSLVNGAGIMTDAERLEATTGDRIEPTPDMECEIIEPHQVANFDNLHLQYLGFCPWVLVHGHGMLIPGNPNMGVVRWEGKYYAFSSVKAAHDFCLKPDSYVAKVLLVARRQPELIELLQLKEEVDAVKVHGELRGREPEPTISCDADVQTELHPIPTFIDPEYTWNVWELKRRAMQLANISKCTTKSTQTVRSDFRRSVYVQVAPDKTKETQTKKDAGTNVPTLSNYIYGLRGRKDDKQRVITLTRPVHE